MAQTLDAGAPAVAGTSRPGLAELVERVRRCTRDSSDPATIAKLVAGVLADITAGPDLLTAEEREGSPEHYTRNTLHAEAAFSIVALVWRPGQITEIHDHLVWCTFKVVQGAETETYYGFSGGRLVEAGGGYRPTGSISAVAPPDDIHRVENTGDGTAITLHVYGADLSQGTSVRRTYELPE